MVFSALWDLNLRLWVLALLLGELLVDEVDLVAILNDLAVLEESVFHGRELRQVLELKVERVQSKLGEEALAEVRVAVQDPHAHQIHIRRAGLTIRAQGRKHGTAVVALVDHLAGGQSAHVASPPLKAEIETFQRRDVVRVELEGKGPVGVLQVVQDALGRRANLLGVELHCPVNERLQTICHLLLPNLATVSDELSHLGGRKEGCHVGGLCIPFKFINPFSALW